MDPRGLGVFPRGMCLSLPVAHIVDDLARRVELKSQSVVELVRSRSRAC